MFTHLVHPGVGVADGTESKTPLHILAGFKNRLTTDSPDEYLLFFRALVYAGSNLYSADDEGNTVVRILNKQLIELQKENLTLNPFIDKLINNVFGSSHSARWN
jgi:hypothetical protein